MKPLVSIIMGSTSDMPVMEAAAKVLDEAEIPFEINALSAHRTPEEVEKFAKGAEQRGLKVIIAAAGMAAHLPGVIAGLTPLPVIGVPIKASIEGIFFWNTLWIIRFLSKKTTKIGLRLALTCFINLKRSCLAAS